MISWKRLPAGNSCAQLSMNSSASGSRSRWWNGVGSIELKICPSSRRRSEIWCTGGGEDFTPLRSALALKQRVERCEGLVGGALGLAPARLGAARRRLELAHVLVVVAVQAQQLPVAAVGRVVGELAQARGRELAPATRADPRQDL